MAFYEGDTFTYINTSNDVVVVKRDAEGAWHYVSPPLYAGKVSIDDEGMRKHITGLLADDRDDLQWGFVTTAGARR